MSTPAPAPNLLDALARLEKCLETPVVPGEMERWTEEVQEAFSQVEPLIVAAVEEDHPQRLKEISQEDPALWRRVEQLKGQDQESIEMQNKLKAQIEGLSMKAEIVEPDELRLEDRVRQLTDDGLSFVIHVRKQETAMDTWMMEALERDRGTVD